MIRCHRRPGQSGLERLATDDSLRAELPVEQHGPDLAAVGVIGPVRAPSGWRLVGISPVAIMDITAPRLVSYRPGDVVRLRSIGADAWDDYAGVHMADLETAP